MKSIVKLLFSSSLVYLGTWAEEASLGRLCESVRQLADELCAVQPELWEKYQKKSEALSGLERWKEFERGFLMAAQLMAEAMGRLPED